jgi:type IV secretory pathway component VirB8
VSLIVCVVLCAVFRLIVVLFCVMCVICLLCLIVLPLPPCKNPFAVKINNNNNIVSMRWERRVARTEKN